MVRTLVLGVYHTRSGKIVCDPACISGTTVLKNARVPPGGLFFCNNSPIMFEKKSDGPLPTHAGLVDHILVEGRDDAIDLG